MERNLVQLFCRTQTVMAVVVKVVVLGRRVKISSEAEGGETGKSMSRQSSRQGK